MDELPKRGEVATEFRALAGSISEEVFSSMFPSINRVLQEYRENSENQHSETTSGVRKIESSMNLLDTNLGDLNFQLEIFKSYQSKSLDLLENLKGKIVDEDIGSIFDKMIGSVFGKNAATKGKTNKGKTAEKGKGKPKGGAKLDKHPDMPVKPDKSKVVKGGGIFTRGMNVLAVVYAVYDAIERIAKLDPADPDYNKKATQEVSAVVARFGAATVGATAGAILGSGIPIIGNITGFIAGLAGGLFVDYYFGDNVEEITKSIIEKLWDQKSKQSSNVPTGAKLASLGAPSGNVFSNADQKQNTTPADAVSVNTGAAIVTASGDDVTVAKEIMFGAKKMKFIGDKLFFTNITGFDTGKKEKGIKFQTRQQNRPSQKIEELQEKNASGEATAGAGTSGGVTPQSSVSGTTTPGSGGGGGAGASGYNPSGAGVNVTGSAQEAMQFFISKGWTPEQAAGIVGNLMTESNLRTGAVGDGGKAYGIAQWHPDRQAKFQQVYGKPIQQSSFQEQLEFVNWELNNTERKAGDIIRSATNAAQAAELTDIHYERSKGLHRYQRMNNAVGLMKNQQQQPTATSSPSIGPGASVAPEMIAPTNQTASLVSAPPKISGMELQKTSSEITSAPKENPEEIRESIQKVVTLNKEYSGPGHYKDSISVEAVGDKDVSVKARLIQQFSHG